MAPMTFPMTTADLTDLMMVQTVHWQLRAYQELSSTAGGEWIAADLGPQLWEAEVSTVEADLETIERLRARFNLLDGAIRSFYLYDPARPNPATDPMGTLLAEAEVTIDTIEANRKEVSFAGLPAGFTLPEGAWFSVTAGAPARTFLGQLAADISANGDGETGPVEFRPHMRSWVANGQAVRLLKPVAKVKIVAGALSVAQVTSVTHRLRFSARQTLAAG
jgi:hypothetical protein